MISLGLCLLFSWQFEENGRKLTTLLNALLSSLGSRDVPFTLSCVLWMSYYHSTYLLEPLSFLSLTVWKKWKKNWRAVRRSSSVHWFTALLGWLISSPLCSLCVLFPLWLFPFILHFYFLGSLFTLWRGTNALPRATPNGLAHQGQNTPPKHGNFTPFPYFPWPVLGDGGSRHMNRSLHITLTPLTLHRKL